MHGVSLGRSRIGVSAIEESWLSRQAAILCRLLWKCGPAFLGLAVVIGCALRDQVLGNTPASQMAQPSAKREQPPPSEWGRCWEESARGVAVVGTVSREEEKAGPRRPTLNASLFPKPCWPTTNTASAGKPEALLLEASMTDELKHFLCKLVLDHLSNPVHYAFPHGLPRQRLRKCTDRRPCPT